MSLLFQLELAAGAPQDQQAVDRLFSEFLAGGLCHLSHYPDMQWLVAFGWGTPQALLPFLTALYQHYDKLPAPLQNQQVHPFAGRVHRVTLLQIPGTDVLKQLEALRRMLRRVGEASQVPVILVEGAARTSIRRSAAIVLANGYRDMEERLKSIPPEFGPAHVHPRHGTLLGSVAAPRWEAYLDLDRQNLNVAQKVARRLRGRDGGVSGVDAIARSLPSAFSSRVLLWCDRPDDRLQGVVEKRLRSIAEEQNVQPSRLHTIGLKPQDIFDLKQPQAVLS